MYFGRENLPGGTSPATLNLSCLGLDLLVEFDFPSDSSLITSINLAHNFLSAIPVGAFRSIPNLTELNMNRCHFSQFPASVFEMWAPSLQRLYLSGNLFTSWPGPLSGLTHLQSLTLSYNQLQSVVGIGGLVHLQEVSLSNNLLQSLPDEIAACTQLRSLDISHNRMSLFPPSIMQLQNLNSLEIRSNQLRIIPTAVEELPSLQFLDISGNTALSPDCVRSSNPNLQIVLVSAAEEAVAAISASIGPVLSDLLQWSVDDVHEYLRSNSNLDSFIIDAFREVC
jgi:Leucine-rich repeat (LRR) protein